MGAIKKMSIITNLQIVFWVSYILLSVYSFSQATSISNSIIRILILLPIQVFLFYGCFSFLIPKYFEKKKITTFYLLLLLLISIITIARLLLKKIIFENLDTGKIVFSEVTQFMIILISELVIVLISCLLAVAKQKYEYEKRYQQSQTQYLESELNYLKAQVSPHFLLNTLNNIYSFAVAKSAETPNAILKLSEILKYFLYESNKEKITIQREWEVIQSYISLFQLKCEHPLNIHTSFLISNNEKQVEPLLLMSLVENAFKHSGIGMQDDAFIRIDASTRNGNLLFNISNSIFDANKTINEYGGIGLKNISKRLVMNYPNNHTLEVDETDKIFSVKVVIPFL
jgi:two-component system, LytTR family, sensor kinase